MDANRKNTIYNLILDSIKETILFQLYREDGKTHRVGKIHLEMLKDIFKMLNGLLINRYYRLTYKKPLKCVIGYDKVITLYLKIYNSDKSEKILNEIKSKNIPEFIKFDYYRYYFRWQYCKILSDHHNYKLALTPFGYKVNLYYMDSVPCHPCHLFDENCIRISYS